MNYLAHLYFGRKTDASLVGNLLADFIKGNEAALLEQFPKQVVDGILMHRNIDKFTDAHASFHESKILLSSHLVKFSGIVIDVFFDHFLAKHWEQYGEGNLEEFVSSCHSTLTKHPEWHSDDLKERLPLLIENEVLLSYLDKEGVKLALERISMRGKSLSALPEAYDDFLRNYEAFEKIFHHFFPILTNYASTLAPTAELDESKTEGLSEEELILTWRQQAVVLAERKFYLNSLVGHFKSKGVSEKAALKESKKIIAEVSLKRRRNSKFILIPGILILILAGVIAFSHLLFPHATTANTTRNLAGAIIAASFGIVLINKSKSVR